MKQLTDKEVYLVAVATIDQKKPEVIALINKYGIKLSPSADLKTIDSAFLTLTKQSANFRKEFSDISAQAYSSFTGENGFFNASGSSLARQQGAPVAQKSGGFAISSNSQTLTDSTDSTSTGKSWKDYFTPDLFGNLFNTGLNILSNKQIGQNAQSAQGNMDTAREQYYEEQSTQKSEKSGMGVGSIILLSVGGLLLLGGIIYFVRKK